MVKKSKYFKPGFLIKIMDDKSKGEEVLKILIMMFLVSFSIFLTSLYKIELSQYPFYTHFLYLPAVLAAFWWGRKGLLVPLFLIFSFILISITISYTREDFFSSVVESAILLIVAVVVSILTEEKNRALEEEREFELMTAHYFFNPICIAEGFLDLAMKNASEEVNEKLELVRIAVQRIKKVVKNVVEKGEIHD